MDEKQRTVLLGAALVVAVVIFAFAAGASPVMIVLLALLMVVVALLLYTRETQAPPRARTRTRRETSEDEYDDEYDEYDEYEVGDDELDEDLDTRLGFTGLDDRLSRLDEREVSFEPERSGILFEDEAADELLEERYEDEFAEPERASFLDAADVAVVEDEYVEVDEYVEEPVLEVEEIAAFEPVEVDEYVEEEVESSPFDRDLLDKYIGHAEQQDEAVLDEGLHLDEPGTEYAEELEEFEEEFATGEVATDIGLIDESKVDSDEAILGAASASSLSATMTEEEANAETREILGRVAALLEKYE
jgi:hypothetical protein